MDNIKPKASADGIAVWCAHDTLMSTDTIVENPRNPNIHPDEQIRLLSKIIKIQGWRAPITISRRTGMVTKGHARLRAAKLLGVSEVPVDHQSYDSEASEFADIIADNRIASLASSNMGMVKDMLLDIDSGAFDLDLTGFSHTIVEAMMTAVPPERIDNEYIPQISPAVTTEKQVQGAQADVNDVGMRSGETVGSTPDTHNVNVMCPKCGAEFGVRV